MELIQKIEELDLFEMGFYEEYPERMTQNIKRLKKEMEEGEKEIQNSQDAPTSFWKSSSLNIEERRECEALSKVIGKYNLMSGEMCQKQVVKLVKEERVRDLNPTSFQNCFPKKSLQCPSSPVPHQK